MKLDTADFLDRFGHEPFVVGHDLADDDRFDVESLARLASSLPATRIECSRADGDVVQDPGTVEAATVPAADAIRRLDETGSWVLLRDIETDPAYRSVQDRTLGSIAPLVEAVDSPPVTAHSFAILSAAGGVTPLHCDLEFGILCQIHGHKSMTVFPAGHPDFVPPDLLERQFASDVHRNLDVAPAALERTRRWTFDLGPGDALLLPWNVPHFVTVSGDDYSVALQIGFQTRRTARLIELHRVNRLLRRIGLHPRPVGRSPRVDAAKHAALGTARAAKHALVR